MKHGSLFTGFGGWDIGAQAAGLELAWGVEYDPEIAAVANANLGGHVRVADILEIDPASLERVDVLHASPPCPNFSVAKRDRGETERDIAMGRKVADFIRHHQPRIFTLENVYGYRQSESWAIIRETLAEEGYWVDMQHVNAGDFGVPQTRRRMIVRAVLGGWVPHLPPPEPWIGWYAAIQDILHTLPPSQFAPWQIKRLPPEIVDYIAQVQGENSGILEKDAPAPTVPAKYRAMLVGGANTSDAQAAPGVGVSGIDEPTMTVNSSNSDSRWRALLVNGQGAGNEWSEIFQEADRPVNTITATEGDKGRKKALLIDGKTSKTGTAMQAMLADEPARTVIGSDAARRDSRAMSTEGRVVAMTPRAIARFQTFPDWYELPDSVRLATKGIGNAVPCLLAEKILRQLVEAIQ